jgi:hypothetical protein
MSRSRGGKSRWTTNFSRAGDPGQLFDPPQEKDRSKASAIRDLDGIGGVVIFGFLLYGIFHQALAATHWAAGAQTSAVSSTVENQEIVLQAGLAVEDDFFKYSESTRRLLTLQYGVNLIHARYSDSTIFGKVRETLMNQHLTLSLSAQQPWGSANIGFTSSTYLHDLSKNRVDIFGGANIPVVKGLSFNLFGSYSQVRDQLPLAKGNVSEEDLLFRLRQLKTSYRNFVFTGLSYMFGSIFNNVVNSRFGSSGGGGFSFSFGN